MIWVFFPLAWQIYFLSTSPLTQITTPSAFKQQRLKKTNFVFGTKKENKPELPSFFTFSDKFGVVRDGRMIIKFKKRVVLKTVSHVHRCISMYGFQSESVPVSI